jgi:hypothetical protein
MGRKTLSYVFKPFSTTKEMGKREWFEAGGVRHRQAEQRLYYWIQRTYQHTTNQRERLEDMRFNKSKLKREKQLIYGPEPPPKLLTTKGLIIRGIIFAAAVAGICYLLWQEFSGRQRAYGCE